MEQQPPFFQFPQTVLPLLAPQLPSVVTAPVGGASVGLPSTGSACDDEAAAGVVGVPPVQPLWHPCALSQLIHREPSIKINCSSNLLSSCLSTPPIIDHELVAVFKHSKGIEHMAYPKDEQQPPNGPFASQGAPPPSPAPHRPSDRGFVLSTLVGSVLVHGPD